MAISTYDDESDVPAGVEESGSPTPSLDTALRPRILDDYVGQEAIKKSLTLTLQAAKQRDEPAEHILFAGPPGLGKTTLAGIIASELQVPFRITSGPALERSGDLASIIASLQPGEVLFIDEIHRLNRNIEEMLYPVMEDYALDLVLGKGAGARTMRIQLPRFTLVGATTRPGSLSSPLRDRFGLHYHLEYYTERELTHIITRTASLLDVDIEDAAAHALAIRSRGTPRVANRLVKRVRDYATVHGDGLIRLRDVQEALHDLGIDDKGLDAIDRRILKTIIEQFDGGPVGVETIAAATAIERATLEDVYEPYLLQIGFLQRTPRGRKVTDLAIAYLNSD
ncbi:MAG TPA: Holliday junction branch migration DNA helicase RuvB [Patescibacteria group bacterium]